MFVALCGLLAWALIAWVHFAAAQIRFYSPLPFYDYWNTVSKISSYRRFDFTVLWEQHNEHRIIFPEIVFAADYLFFRGREILPSVLSNVFYASIWLVLSASLGTSLRYMSKMSQLIQLCGIFLAGVVMAWKGGANLIATPFMLQWTLTLAMAPLALLLLQQVPISRCSWFYLAGVIVCCVVCNYSSANGLFFWAIVFAAAFILRISKQKLSILAASAAISIAVYFVGYHFFQQTKLSIVFAHPIYTISFIAAYLGMPFTAVTPRLGVSFGLFELVAYFAFVALAVRRRCLSTGTGVVLFGFYFFCLLTAFITAAGRMDPQDSAFGAAMAQRYILTPLAAHATLILTAAWLISNSRYYLWIPFYCVFALGFALLGKSQGVRSWLEFERISFANVQLASLAFESGVDDLGLMKTIYPGGEQVAIDLPILRKGGLSTFASGRMEWLGRPAASVFPIISDQPEPGAVTAVRPLTSGLVVLGWTESPRRIWGSQQFVFLDENQRIIGFGRKLPAGLPPRLASFDTPQSIAWVGFVNRTFDSKSFLCYAVEMHGKALVPVGRPTAIPPISGIRADQVGEAIPSIDWDLQGAWMRNGPIPSKPADMPPATSYYESWAGDDSNTGTIASHPFSNPPGNCLVVTGAHGPSTEGLSETVIDADRNQPIASVPFTPGDIAWHYWKVDLPASVQHVRIVAQDQGRHWGEWQMIGDLHLCK